MRLGPVYQERPVDLFARTKAVAPTKGAGSRGRGVCVGRMHRARCRAHVASRGEIHLPFLRRKAPLSFQSPLSPYVVVILSKSTSTAPGYEPLYEESFAYITASSQGEALEKARKRMEGEDGLQYKNVVGDTVTWSAKLVEIGDALSDHLEDGEEFYARFFRNADAYEQLGFVSFDRGDSSVGFDKDGSERAS